MTIDFVLIYASKSDKFFSFDHREKEPERRIFSFSFRWSCRLIAEMFLSSARKFSSKRRICSFFLGYGRRRPLLMSPPRRNDRYGKTFSSVFSVSNRFSSTFRRPVDERRAVFGASNEKPLLRSFISFFFSVKFSFCCSDAIGCRSISQSTQLVVRLVTRSIVVARRCVRLSSGPSER